MLKENYKFVFKLGLILFLIVSISTLALSIVNNVTEDIIIQKNIELQNNARKNVLPDADRFEKDSSSSVKDDSIREIYIAYKGNDRVGYCISVSSAGYGGEINMIVGVKEDLTVSGVNIISMSETAGLGANSQKPEFLQQYTGKKHGIEVVKTPSDSLNAINAISGATITSNAVTNGVNNALKSAKILKGVIK